MKRIYLTIRETQIAVFLLPAMLLGISWGIFLHGYWLIDFLSIDSKRLLVATILMSLLGMAGYISLFYFLRKETQNLSRSQLMGLIAASIFTGSFLFFTTTDRWQLPTRYFTLLLPKQTVQVSIPPGQDVSPISILWIKTSMGDLSYDSIEYQGWRRDTDKLVLTDPSNNSLLWSEKTGEEVQIVFQVPSRSGEAIIFLNGQREVVHFSAQKNTFTHSFDVPFYASRGLVLFLGLLNFIFLCFPLCLLAWSKRSEILLSFERSMNETVRFNGWEWLVVAGTMLLAFILRFPNLENLFPGVDEYYQLIAARQITLGVPLGDVYSRSLWVVTLPVSIMFRIFGNQLWAARLPGVIINMLAIIPLYLITRKINRPVAIISILLYATSPWVIVFARMVREYAYYPFLFYWIIYGMIVVLEKLPASFRLDRDIRAFLDVKTLSVVLGLAVVPVYGFYDITSTFKLILIAYMALVLFIFLRMDWRSKINLLVVFLVALGALISILIWFKQFSLVLGFNTAPLRYFFVNPPQQWYFDRVALIPLVGLVGIVAISFLVWRVNFIPAFILAVFSAFLSFFVFSSNHFLGTRHLSTTNLWYIILLAMGLYLLWVFLRTFQVFKKNRLIFSTFVILGFLMFNFQHSMVPILDRDPYVSISKDYAHDLGAVHEFMLKNVKDGDILIASVYGLYTQWTGTPVFRDVYRFDTQTTGTEVLSLVDQNDSGWIVIDTIRADLAAFDLLGTFSKDGRIEYVGKFGDELVWRWGVQ